MTEQAAIYRTALERIAGLSADLNGEQVWSAMRQTAREALRQGAGEDASAWQPIESWCRQANGSRILAAWMYGGKYVFGAASWREKDGDELGWHDDAGGAWFDDDDEECNPPTHWMPLPVPPKEGLPA